MSGRIRYIALLFTIAFCLAGCKPSSPAAHTPAASADATRPAVSEQFLSLMNVGKNYLDQGDATNAIDTYHKARALAPNDLDLRLNLASAHLLAGAAPDAIREADEALQLDPNSAAAYFIKGSAALRLAQAEEAVKALENANKAEPGVTATLFQLGLARTGLKQWPEAVIAFREGLALDPNHLHAPVHYLLAQALLRAGRPQEAEQELQQHQLDAAGSAPAAGAATFERSKYTRARVPFKLDQPAQEGIRLTFTDATQTTLGENAQKFSGPLGVIDVHHTGWNSLFATETGKGFRLLWNTHGRFVPDPVLHPAISGARYSKMLVADLQNDRFDDVIVLGDPASHLFQFHTNGLANDVSQTSRLGSLAGLDGALIDLDFTGKLDLVAITGAHTVRIFRQFGPLLFNDVTSTSGIPSTLSNAVAISMEDWNRDDHMDLIASRASGSPLLLEKQRGGPLVPREITNWITGPIICAGDFDNDLRPDLAVVQDEKIVLCLNGGDRKEIPAPGLKGVQQIVAIDYDNDGWLDLWTVGDQIRAWRNLGLAGFKEQTAPLGLAKLQVGPVAEIHFADFDRDCDSDAILGLANGGLCYLRNDGGQENLQAKVQLIGNRSNASGIGCKVEIETGGLRLLRTVRTLPVEIGVGKNARLDSFLVHWFNWPQGAVDLPLDCQEPLLSLELTIQEGSCPYLYAWDGERFRFVTDILGAAPLGLPVAEGRYIEADPEEYVWIGNEQTFRPKDGAYQLQITEELREVLYLDEAKLVVVDHEPGTEVHPTDKLLPGGPFPPGTLLTLHREHPLRHAEMLEGQDVTSALLAVDGRRVSPPRLRTPQLRGLAEPHGLILDFGPLEAAQPLVLVLNGWLRFGGGMANIAASHDPSFPFPFPALEAETAPGVWTPVDVVVGAPAGKTKTILVDLAGKLPPGTRQLRLTEAFEIHWDRIALLEKDSAPPHNTVVSASAADLHFRGFSALQPLPSDSPLTPDYQAVSPNSYWTIIPGGWCTRYGDVAELLASRDEGLALLNSGDELTLKFSAAALPPKPPGTVREFFLYVDGWDKDSDFHVATGTQVEPLPFHGMDDQLYGQQKRPAFPTDTVHRKYNTRWVEAKPIKQAAR